MSAIARKSHNSPPNALGHFYRESEKREDEEKE